ncbi:hypothetical protein BGZ63DRAFT_378684 [Mariannaea sp. PMI_226]|nr:hypothetical protein BGZ63DRAFT_378684 [Mariannaea sp. PMI_226]
MQEFSFFFLGGEACLLVPSPHLYVGFAISAYQVVSSIGPLTNNLAFQPAQIRHVLLIHHILLLHSFNLLLYAFSHNLWLSSEMLLLFESVGTSYSLSKTPFVKLIPILATPFDPSLFPLSPPFGFAFSSANLMTYHRFLVFRLCILEQWFPVIKNLVARLAHKAERHIADPISRSL